MAQTERHATFIQNPDIDLLFGCYNTTIPSKRQDFKPIQVWQSKDDGTEEILNDFYVKKPSTQSVRQFELLIRNLINPTPQDNKILNPSLVEVVIVINLTKDKYFNVDVDNIAKTVLDSIKGIIFEDDNQVKRLIVEKDIHPLNKDGFFIAVTELKPGRKGILGEFHLFSEQR